MLIRREAPRIRTAQRVREGQGAILDSRIAARLGRPGPARRPWFNEANLRDGLMTFALTFTGAIIFLL